MKKKIVGLLSLILCFTLFAMPISAAEIVEKGTPNSIVQSTNIEPRYQYIIKTNGGNVNVRSGPGLEYPVIGSLPNGTIVDIPFLDDHETKPGWEYVYTDIVDGYVSTQYIANIE